MASAELLERYAAIRSEILAITPEPYRAITEQYLAVCFETDVLVEQIMTALNAGDRAQVLALDDEYRAKRRQAEALKPGLWKGSDNGK